MNQLQEIKQKWCMLLTGRCDALQLRDSESRRLGQDLAYLIAEVERLQAEVQSLTRE